MSKTCFVIMPFGSASPDQKKKFDGVYKGIIVPAVREAGYEPIREDISATPGSIPKSIVTKLAEAEMVIADLTSFNPNVFYELGIRHVFSKSGTVLIISKGESIPFDNASHRVIQYTNELADLDDIHKQIVTAITNRENSIEHPDNIVHDTYPKLPINTIGHFFESVRDERIEQLRKQVSELSKEKKRLEKLCLDNGISLEAYKMMSARTVKELMADARFSLEKSGPLVMLRLRQFASIEDIDGFIDYLEGVLEAGYMSEQDYVQVNTLCGQLGFLPLQAAVMERAYDLFPESESVIRNLSDVYTQMPLKETKLKGVKIIENLLGIQVHENKYSFSKPSAYINENNLSALFNAYMRLDFYERTISVCESYEKLELPFMPLILRNKASAYDDLKMYAEAKEAYIQLLKADYYDDTNHAFYAAFLSNIGDYVNAYKEREIAAILDQSDANRFINLGVCMLNYSYVREDHENIVRVTKHHKIINYAMPLFLYAVQIDGSNDKRTRIAEILSRRNLANYAQAILANQPIIDTEFIQYPLNYILSSNIEDIKARN